MHHRQRCGVEERRHEIAIRGRIDAVEDDTRESERSSEPLGINRVTRSRNRARPQRQRIGFVGRGLEPFVIAAQRRGVR